MSETASRRKAQGRYDTGMIRDFLVHLRWEVRAEVSEADHPGATDPELAEELRRYTKKYGVGLRPMVTVDPGGASPEQLAAVEALRAQWVRSRKELLAHLEALQ